MAAANFENLQKNQTNLAYYLSVPDKNENGKSAVCAASLEPEETGAMPPSAAEDDACSSY
jgi:hypothetical protein